MTRPWRGARADARGHGERGERAAHDGRGERAVREAARRRALRTGRRARSGAGRGRIRHGDPALARIFTQNAQIVKFPCIFLAIFAKKREKKRFLSFLQSGGFPPCFQY